LFYFHFQRRQCDGNYDDEDEQEDYLARPAAHRRKTTSHSDIIEMFYQLEDKRERFNEDLVHILYESMEIEGRKVALISDLVAQGRAADGRERAADGRERAADGLRTATQVYHCFITLLCS